MINVILIDDHPIVRAGIRMVLEKADGIHVQAEGVCGKDALKLVAEHQPHVLVLDVNLPDFHGLEVTRKLMEKDCQAAILILTAHDDSQNIFGLLKTGVKGYVLKDEALETLADAVRAVSRGELWMSQSVTSRVVKRAISKSATKKLPPIAKQPEDIPLTPREIEVLALLAQGMDNGTIAETLVTTKRTIQNHISNIYGKLAVTSRTEAMLYAFRNGIADFPSLDGEN
ncbi:MAG: response regulator transcription factor [Anaerolineaceae bacterium]|nr:response regulator transcription factor [Anaerolineaceae bacterium]